MAEGVTVATAYVDVVPSMSGGNATDAITKAIAPGVEGAGKESGKRFGSGILSSAKGALVGAAAPLVAALGVGAIGSALFDIGKSFDDMKNTIIVGTGASGDALEGLCDSAKAIATEVPISFEGAGNIVQDLNTRMALVGDDLEDVGTRVAGLGKLIGSDINLDQLTGTMNAFSVANDQVASKMDYLFSVSQATGIGFDALTGVIETNAPVMQSLGFSLEETANMAGLLDKAGMDANGTMSKMSKALVNLAEPGQSASDAFNDVINQMQGFLDAGDQASALDIASKVFGTRGAAQFVGALQSGAFSLEQIRDLSLGAGEGIMGTVEQTMTAGEKFDVLKNRAAEALEPLASGLIDGATMALDGLLAVMDFLSPAFEFFGGIINDYIRPALEWLIDGIGGFASGVGDFLAGAGANLQSFGEGVMTTFGTVGETIQGDLQTAASVGGSTVDAFTSLLSGDFDGAAASAQQAFSTLQTAAIDKVSAAQNAIVPIANEIGEKLGFPGLGDKVNSVFEGIKNFMEDPIGAAKDAIGGIIDNIKGFFNFEFKLPELKLPHIVFDIIEIPVLGKIPNPATFRIDWYARGGIVDEPTIIGAGEAGREALVPLTQPNVVPFARAVADEVTTDQGAAYEIRMLRRELAAIIRDNVPSALTVNRRVFAQLSAESGQYL